VCTQNIDNLHEQAGSRRVLHMHGELNKARCHDCGDVSLADGDLTTNLGCAACGRIGGLRPNVVWFGETPLFMDQIFDALAGAGLFVSIGTSGAVYPAAGFVNAAREAGNTHVQLFNNKDEVPAYLAPKLRPDDVVLFLGAGNINHVAPLLLAELEMRS